MNENKLGRKPVGGVVAVVFALAAGFGAGWYAGPGPAHRYCDDCGEILTLQSEPDKDDGDRNEIYRLRTNLEEKQSILATVDRMAGRPPDLHPDCECACHRYWLGEASRVHGA